MGTRVDGSHKPRPCARGVVLVCTDISHRPASTQTCGAVNIGKMSSNDRWPIHSAINRGKGEGLLIAVNGDRHSIQAPPVRARLSPNGFAAHYGQHTRRLRTKRNAAVTVGSAVEHVEEESDARLARAGERRGHAAEQLEECHVVFALAAAMQRTR